MAGLVISVNNEKKGIILEAVVGKEVVIGRDKDCDVSLPDVTGLSRRHCRISYTQDGFVLCDLQSTNGTYADSERLEKETPMQEGVHYMAGEAQFQIIGLKLIPKPTTETPSATATQQDKIDAGQHTQQEEKKADKAPAGLGANLSPDKLREIQEKNAIRRRIEQLRADWAQPKVSVVSVILVLVIAFYLGLALYSLISYGNPLPIFIP